MKVNSLILWISGINPVRRLTTYTEKYQNLASVMYRLIPNKILWLDYKKRLNLWISSWKPGHFRLKKATSQTTQFWEIFWRVTNFETERCRTTFLLIISTEAELFLWKKLKVSTNDDLSVIYSLVRVATTGLMLIVLTGTFLNDSHLEFIAFDTKIFFINNRSYFEIEKRLQARFGWGTRPRRLCESLQGKLSWKIGCYEVHPAR